MVVMLSATAVWDCHGSCLCCGFYAVGHCGDIVAMGVVCVVVVMLSAIAVLVDMASVCGLLYCKQLQCTCYHDSGFVFWFVICSTILVQGYFLFSSQLCRCIIFPYEFQVCFLSC